MSSFGELYFGRIPDRTQAAASVRAAARGFYLVALLYVLDPLRVLAALETSAPIVPFSQVIDAALLVFLASNMAHWQSRAFAILLIPWVFFFSAGVLFLRAEHVQFGSNMFVPALGLYLAFRGVLGTVRYHRFAGTRLRGGAIAIKAAAGTACAVAAVLALQLGLPAFVEISLPNRISMMLLAAAAAYALPFAPWFPFLGRMRLTVPGAAAPRTD
jgi:hypothetical protein